MLLADADPPATTKCSIVAAVDMVRRFGKGRRIATLRKHVKTWTKVRDWMKVTFGNAWPSSADEFALYLKSRASEPCGKSVPGSIYKTMLSMENAGEFPAEEQLGKTAAVKNVLEEITMQLAEAAPRFAKRAWHLPVMRLKPSTRGICARLQSYPRVYAWFRLIKLWAGMRFSDTLGMDHKTLKWKSFGLTAVLSGTKTSGPGKKVSLLRIWISKECWIITMRRGFPQGLNCGRSSRRRQD